jgi:hypothetical protein
MPYSGLCELPKVNLFRIRLSDLKGKRSCLKDGLVSHEEDRLDVGLESVFQIRHILKWIQILGSVPYTGLRIRILLFSSLAFKVPTRVSFFAYYLLLLH